MAQSTLYKGEAVQSGKDFFTKINDPSTGGSLALHFKPSDQKTALDYMKKYARFLYENGLALSNESFLEFSVIKPYEHGEVGIIISEKHDRLKLGNNGRFEQYEGNGLDSLVSPSNRLGIESRNLEEMSHTNTYLASDNNRMPYTQKLQEPLYGTARKILGEKPFENAVGYLNKLGADTRQLIDKVVSYGRIHYNKIKDVARDLAKKIKASYNINHKSLKGNEAGVTLTELMVSIIVIGILASVIVPRIAPRIGDSIERKKLNGGVDLMRSIYHDMGYYEQTKRSIPSIDGWEGWKNYSFGPGLKFVTEPDILYDINISPLPGTGNCDIELKVTPKFVEEQLLSPGSKVKGGFSNWKKEEIEIEIPK